ncbi:MAG: DUF2207 domain-containing protein [Clostridia bacterium]|nr:DUF2207 domain-containing protein [Clostridia bacterium]
MKKSKFFVSTIAFVILTIVSLLMCLSDVVGSTANVDLSLYSQEQDVVSITNLNVDVSVSKNNIAEVKETFCVTFNKNNLSEVIRYVPYASYVYHETENGVDKKIHYSKIYDIDGVGEYGETCNIYYDEENGYLTIGLRKVEGFFEKDETRNFTISYRMDMGKDTNKGFDEVYFNIVGTNSLLTIENVSFQVALPGDESQTKSLNVYYGKDGSTKTLEVTRSGELVMGSVDKLDACEGITIRAVFEDDFLTYDKEIFASQIVSIIAAFVAVVLAVVIALKFIQRKNYPRPIEVACPEGVTPLSADVFVNGECGEKAISAAIVYLASKKYLKIKQLDTKKIVLLKLKDADDKLDSSLKGVFNTIFTSDNKEVMLEDLSVDFFTKAKVIRNTTKTKVETALYDDKKRKLKNTLTAFCIIAMTVSIASLALISVEFFGFWANTLAPFVVSFVFFATFTIYTLTVKNHFIFKYLVCAMFVFIDFVVYFKGGYSQIDGFWLGFVAMILISPLSILASGEALYSKEGKTQKGRIEGFKDFILKCEVSQLKMFAEENPSYYFDVLPYAYVFGLSDVWMEKFKSIEITIPDWVEMEGVDIVDILIFNSMFNNFMLTSHNNFIKSGIAMARSSSSSFGGGSFGGGFGGGGFSGGGVGGGGFGAR